MTLHPLDIDGAFIAEARTDGLDTEALREVAAIGFHFNLMNRLADAFDFAVPTGKQKARMARLLNAGGRRLGDSAMPPVPEPGDDGRLRPLEVGQLRTDLLTKPGVTEPSLRVAVDRFVRRQWELPGHDAAEVPGAYAPYLKKLARHAYRIVDEDLDHLRGSGLSDEAIYELTATAAVTSASVGLEQVYGAAFGAA